MISLVLAQLRARWGQAVTLLVLSAVAVAGAASAPLYAEAVDRAAIAHALDTSTGAARLASYPAVGREWSERQPLPLEAQERMAEQLPGFEPVTSIEIRVRGLGEGAAAGFDHRMIARDGFCQHAVFRSGRCPVGSREIALPARLADTVELGVGDQVALEPIVSAPMAGWVSDGPPVPLAIVGVLEAADPAAPYWAAALDPLGQSGRRQAIMTNRGVVQHMEHTRELVYVDTILPDAAFTPDRIPLLRAQLEAAGLEVATSSAGRTVSEIPRLLDRVAEDGRQARALLPITAAPLVALCWLVIYLAVGNGLAGRRQEVGVVALRGARPWTRALAVATESLAPVLAGLPAGVALAYLVVWLAAPGGVSVPIGAADSAMVTAAGLAAAGTVAAALQALRRELAAPVAQLLRRVPPRRRLAVAAAEVLAVALAVVVVADMRAFDRELVGLMVVAPAVVMLAVAVLVARLLRPLVSAAGRWSLRRGWLGSALAALYLARRPGAARLVVALGLVLAMLGFALVSTDTAAQGRVTEVERALGADRVLSVEVPERVGLLAAVRAVDPDGRYAMAVVSAPSSRDEPASVALDATRLAQVATWSRRYGEAGPAEVAQLLRPPARDPVVIGDGELVAEMSLDRFAADDSLTVSLRLEPLAGGQPVAVAFGPLSAAERSYRVEVDGCSGEAGEAGEAGAAGAAGAAGGPAGCRLAGLVLSTTDPGDRYGSIGRTGLVLHALAHDGVEVLGDLLTDAAHWRAPDGIGTATPVLPQVVAGGLELVVRTPRHSDLYHLLVLDSAYPLPVVATGGSPPGGIVTNVDSVPIRVDEVAQLPGLPGLPDGGLLMDLEYALRGAIGEPERSRPAQVWLAPDAPEELVEQLREAGLTIHADRDVAVMLSSLEASGAAQALRFFRLAAVAAVLVGMLALALVVGIDRGGWSRHLRELRAQGLPERAVSRAGLGAYGASVLAAAVAGALAVGAAWLATSDRLPLGLDRAVVPPWPQWPAVAVPWTAVVAVLLVAAVVAARWQRARPLRFEGRVGG